MWPCASTRNLLAFRRSKLGTGYYLPANRHVVSFYQLEPDVLRRGHTFSAFGRYAMFQVLGPSPRVRLVIDLTTTVQHDASNRLPPAAVVGATRVPLPLVGRGSARVFSAPLQPQVIAGQPYVMLDMGVDGRQRPTDHPGLQGLYGRSVKLDPRFLTSYVRDISLVSDSEYRRLRPPLAIRNLATDLANPDLEYSGLYEDGWMGEDGYAVLAGGGRADLVVKADVPESAGRHLEIMVDGRRVVSRAVVRGLLDLRVPVQPSDSPRRIELRWTGARSLPAPDLRPASAHLRFLGLVPPKAPQSLRSAIQRFPEDLARVEHAGLYADGWLAKDSYVVLAGGGAADLVLRADVLRGRGQHLEVLVNGRQVASRSVKPGPLELRVRVRASRSHRRVELRWAGTTPLASPDTRHAAALLRYLGLTLKR